jgi:hypothetical protein
MRKGIILLPVICLLAISARAQRSIQFKIKYVPEHRYESTVSMTSNIEMNIENLSKDDSDRLIKQGITMPLSLSITILSDLSISAGGLNAQNTFPITFRFNSVKRTGTLNGKEMPGELTALTGAELHATSTQTDDLHLDSISGRSLDTSLRKELTAMFNGVISELRLPEKTVKVGDTLMLKIPYNIPMNGADAAITVTEIYKLISIKKGLAKFDIDQSSQLSIANIKSGQKMAGKGGGHGEMIYDIKQNFPKSINRDLSIDYEMKYKGRLVKGKATIGSYYFFSVANSRAK